MADNIQSISSGSAELKDYYDPYNSIYEAIKRRRKKRMTKEGVVPEDEGSEFNQVPNPDI